MKLLKLSLLALIAALSGFVIHVIAAKWLPGWVSIQMQGIELKPSWAVRYIAGMTSLEYGVATIILYSLLREKIIKYGKFKAALLLSTLLLALNALLIRQPLMDLLIGNPFHVVIVQNLLKWLTWIVLSFIVVFGYELINKTKLKIEN